MIVNVLKSQVQKYKFKKNVIGERIHHMKGNHVSLSADFSAETLKARREWDDIRKRKKKDIVIKLTANQECYT